MASPRNGQGGDTKLVTKSEKNVRRGCDVTTFKKYLSF